LHEAAQHGDDEMVELFLSAGADPTIVVDDGRTAVDLAEAEGHSDVAARLRDVAAQRRPGPSATAR
jgi:ankyrin repeat protein